MIPRLHVVTDDEVLAGPDFHTRAESVLQAGGDRLALHLRGPGASGRRIHDAARALSPVAADTGGLLLVNDRVDVALALGLGVHLGRRSLPVSDARNLAGTNVRVGAAVGSAEAAAAAAGAGADFVILGTIFPSSSHPGRPGAGPGLVGRASAEASVPVMAIGGITVERVRTVMAEGAYGVAVLSGVWAGPNPGARVQSYLGALHEPHGPPPTAERPRERA